MWSPKYTLILSSLVAIGYGLLVWYIIWGLHGTYSVEGTRLLLVLTLTIAMFGFGGLLIARALFAGKDEKFEERFRLGREIFLVFSGIFGTIIGFYFGTSDSEVPGANPAVEVAYAEGQVTAAVTDGTEPFIGILTRAGEAAGEMMTSNRRTLTFAATPCPEGASILVVDGRGRRSEATVTCEANESTGAPAGDNAANANNSAENATP
ncbi:MAG TPA: hypothetical protein VJM15_00360 [Sphingomicrobium sp.]|nr:hypothetical protein [Sphingomicrobium sp.]